MLNDLCKITKFGVRSGIARKLTLVVIDNLQTGTRQTMATEEAVQELAHQLAALKAQLDALQPNGANAGAPAQPIPAPVVRVTREKITEVRWWS